MTMFPSARRYRIKRRPPESIQPSTPRPMRRDCHGRLVSALLDRAGPGWETRECALTAWASATFLGARHVVTLRLEGEDAEDRAQRVVGCLPEAEFAIPGHIVADVAIDTVRMTDGGATVALSILTIEAW
ncbi:MAG: hypothetical protein ABW184_02400 [Sphingobium sp.]